MDQKTYLYDVHIHTAESSKCGKDPGAVMAAGYKELGYDGIIVTDHFFNGNCSAPKDIPWADRVEILTAGYRAAKEYGDKNGLDVFFAWEASSYGNDFLTYGLDIQWLLNNPDVDKLPIREYLAYCREQGAVIIHAHPFRADTYIPMVRLIPDLTDAVEIMNAQRTFNENARARMYAESYGFPMTAGSDAHFVAAIKGAGVVVAERITSPLHYAQLVLQRKLLELRPAPQHTGTSVDTDVRYKGR